MTRKLGRAVWVLAVIATGYAHPLAAETFVWNVSLGGLALGQVEYRDEAPQRLATQVDRTPLGVFNGSFEARSQTSGADLTRYVSQSRTSRKDRDISFLIRGGVVGDVAVTPASELTPLSRPDRVPAGVLDPVAAFGRLARATDCPTPFRLYDGRRVVAISTDKARREDGLLSCQVTYQIVKGPGHLSPFRFKRFQMELAYGTGAPGLLTLDRLVLKVGVFTLRLQR